MEAQLKIDNVNWPVCNPDFVIQAMKSLQTDSCFEKKEFYKSYKSWGTLSTDQKNKTIKFFEVQSDAIQKLIKMTALSIESREASNDESRAEVTSKHDRTRLIMLMARSDMQTTWIKVFMLRLL